MKNSLKPVNFLLVIVLLCILGLTALSEETAPTVFVHANVISMESDRVAQHQTVIISEGKIAAVGADGSLTIPEHSRVIDAQGKYMIPGLTDMHVHVYEPEDLYVWLAHGVTTVLNLNGFPQHLAWRKKLAGGSMDGPTLYTSGPTIYQAGTAREGDSLVEAYHAAGYDCIKIYNDVTSDAYDGIIAAAKRHDMLTVGHIPRAPEFETVLKSGMAIAHAEEFIYTIFKDTADYARIPEVVRRAKEANLTIIATLTAYEHIARQVENLDSMLAQPDIRLAPPWIRETWTAESNRYSAKRGFKIWRLEQRLAFQRKFIEELHRAGVRILAGTDGIFNAMVTGSATLKEVENFVVAGFTPYEALRAATVDAAAFLRASGEWGTITAGKRADLVLCDANPLLNIHAIEHRSGVMARGTWYPQDELRSRLDELPGRYEKERTKFAWNVEHDLPEAVRYLNESDPSNLLLDSAILGRVHAGKYQDLVGLLRSIHNIDPATWAVREQMINDLGYRIMAQKDRTKGAIEVFKLNTQLYPKSPNTYDSLAEACMNDGDNESARKYYLRALELDPGWVNAKNMLKKLK
ncbi:MAG TPA: amidohydrolase family protein [Bacteroidota bacterium]|jgi:tetratricopeptide (TPR) repeat protein|nr:amidohydrolase family protein [Bacteroidota bacterium]